MSEDQWLTKSTRRFCRRAGRRRRPTSDGLPRPVPGLEWEETKEEGRMLNEEGGEDEEGRKNVE